MVNLTDEQRAAVESRGKVIVSASAGSGKTFVMIKKLTDAVVAGADLDDVLAVTFTKKAAAQLKEKLRSALIKRVEGADDNTAMRLKAQLAKIPAANISTIHSFCAKLLRTYFYALDIDGGFDIISDDDAVAKTLKSRAIDELFERLYCDNDPDFKLLLKCLMRKRSDASVKRLLESAYSSVRSTANYADVLKACEKLYTEEGFRRVCGECLKRRKMKIDALKCGVDEFERNFTVNSNGKIYATIFEEMRQSLLSAANDLFDEKRPLTVTRKPSDASEDKEAGEAFKAFKENLTKRFNAARGDYADEATERENFFESGRLATAFSRVLMQFDAEYAEVKRDENKLDYNDLEHLTLKLLTSPENSAVREEIAASFKYVFVDEYQDVNPVQERIISELCGEVFLVGDVKQAIYGFRGSRSLFFSQKIEKFTGGEGTALRLSSNFRSSDGVVNFVNALFSSVMREELCGFDYAATSKMVRGGAYPENYGKTKLCVFGKEEKKERELGVYSVVNGGEECALTREGLAAVSIIRDAVRGEHYDLSSGSMVRTKYSDICILTRKNKGPSTEGIVRALREHGIPVSGAGESNICSLPEVKQFLDILSLIDNAEQDVPLVTALLSPLGNMTENELAYVRIAAKENRLSVSGKISFRECCRAYAKEMQGTIAEKLNKFYEVFDGLRSLSEILNTGALADEILEKYGLEAAYGVGGGEKLKNVLRLIAEGSDLPLPAFLEKIKAGGFDISAPAAAPSDSVKIMTMHAAKGLEFPVVIIADICRSFKGTEFNELPFDDEFGFAPRCYDTENMLVKDTVLRKLCKLRTNAEELKNELNLFYVACTRAMCELYILAEEVTDYDPVAASDARCYAQLFDMNEYFPTVISPSEGDETNGAEGSLTLADEGLVAEISARFARKYAYSESVNLPVKSSASAILRSLESEPYYEARKLFGGEGETGTERGTAYHRFLELCDFSLRSREQIESEIKGFVECGKMSEEQAALLSSEELEEILKIPVFSTLTGARLYREREFLCRLPANEILQGVTASDFVLVQGAIDLFAEGDFGYKIIDYKYSRKSDEELIKTYSAQLNLYRKAVSGIYGVDEKSIAAVIVNIHTKRQIEL